MSRYILLAVLTCTVCLQASGPQARPYYFHDRSVGEGQLWLSWIESQRESFVFGYLRGYQTGFTSACLVYSEAAPKNDILDLNHSPLQKCKLQQLVFSKTPNQYAQQITIFYEKYPSDGDVPVFWLIQAFSDSEKKTAEEVHAAWSNQHGHP